MKQHHFSCSDTLPLPRAQVFSFFADAANLERITPPELRFRITSPLPVDMREEALIRYRLRLFGIPFGWLTRITVWNPPFEFVDLQVSGPYRRWIHQHRFEEVEGGTRIQDTVDYALPFSPLGELAAPLVAAEVARIFRWRTAAIRRLLLDAEQQSKE